VYFLTDLGVFYAKGQESCEIRGVVGVLTTWSYWSILTPGPFLFKMMTFQEERLLNKGITGVIQSGGKDRQIPANVLLNNNRECVNVTSGCREGPVKQT